MDILMYQITQVTTFIKQKLQKMQRDIKKNTIIRDVNIPFSTRQIKHEKTHKDKPTEQNNQ